jgi:hypothetical protein
VVTTGMGGGGLSLFLSIREKILASGVHSVSRIPCEWFQKDYQRRVRST